MSLSRHPARSASFPLHLLHAPLARRGSALLGLALLMSGVGSAQTHRVAKPEKVTRAIGVYEWTGEMDKPSASRLVPVSLFIDGHLEDAGVYLARPVPFALNPGFLYSVEVAGEPFGVLDLDEARNVVTRRSQDDDNPLGAWYGYGRYTPPAAAPKAPALHTSAHPSVIVSSAADGRPHLANRTGSDSAPAKPTDPAASKPAGNDSTSKSAAPTPPVTSDDPDRPHMSRRSEASPDSTSATAPTPDDPDRPRMSRRSNTSSTSDAPASSTGSPASPSATDDDPERPTLRRREAKSEGKRKKESGSGVTPMATSLNDDPDRPTLGRGGATEPTGTPRLTGMPADLRQAVAVSDATTVDAHPFARNWESTAERTATLAAFQALARPRLANYLTLNQMQPGTAQVVAHTATSQPIIHEDTAAPPKLQRGKPTAAVSTEVPKAEAPRTPASKAAAAAAPTKAAVRSATGAASHRTVPGHSAAAHPLLLQGEQLTGFTLSYGGVPTFVYTALTPNSVGQAVYITLVAQQLPSGELQIALSSVTDEAHLDRTPWLRLVDVVDPTDSHRASFLFELRAKASRQFALYSLVSSRAEQSFVTGLIE